MNRKAITTMGLGLASVCFADSANAQLSGLRVTEHVVTATTTWETSPRLGNDQVSNLVTFTRRALLPDGSMGRGDIWLQRLDDHGTPSEPALQLSSGPENCQHNDVSGDCVVWTAYDTTSTLSGRIMAYQISTNLLHTVAEAVVAQEPRVHGGRLAWRESTTFGPQVMLYDLAWLGTPHVADIIAGPIPPTYSLDIGERFVVWTEQTSGQRDVFAFELQTAIRIDVSNTPTTVESEPSVDGPWIAWQEQDLGASESRIRARNMDTDEVRLVAGGGVYNFSPSISGDILTYEKMSGGVRVVCLYRISTGENWQVSGTLADSYGNDVFGNLIAHVDQRTGSEDIYVTEFEFTPASYCEAKINSRGCVPVISYSGTPTLSGPDDFFVTASQVLSNQWGILLWSGGQANLPMGGGTLCLASPILRTPAQPSGGNPPPADCSGSYAFHFSHEYFAAHFVWPGTELCAQFLSRDPAFAPPNNIGLTNALRLTVGP